MLKLAWVPKEKKMTVKDKLLDSTNPDPSILGTG